MHNTKDPGVDFCGEVNAIAFNESLSEVKGRETAEN